MNAESTARSRAEIADEISKWAVGGGIITMALFPSALPILALTAIAALPLLLLALAAGLLVLAIALPILVVGSLGRRALRALHPRRTAVLGHGLHG
jgi:polyferredoxin